MEKNVVMAVLPVLIASGCLSSAFSGEESGLIGKVLGIWHYQGESMFGTPRMIENVFFEIIETSIVRDDANGQRKIRITLTEEYDMVVVRHARTGEEAYEIEFIDQDTIETWLPVFGQEKLKRVTAETRAKLLKEDKDLAEARNNKPKPLSVMEQFLSTKSTGGNPAASSLGTIADVEKNGIGPPAYKAQPSEHGTDSSGFVERFGSPQLFHDMP